MLQLRLNLTASTTTLPARAGVQLVYLLLEADAISDTPHRAATHCCLVVDCSPSMRVPIADEHAFRELMRRGLANEVMLDGLPVWHIANGLPDDLKDRVRSPSRWVVQAVGGAVERLDAADRLSLVAFASQAQTILLDQPPTAPAVHPAISQLERRDLGALTRLGPGLRTALRLLRERQVPGRADRVVVLTDGFVEDEDECFAAAEDFRSAGIPITTLGLGIEFQERLLMSLADHSGGNAHLIADASAIPAVLGREFGQTSRIVASRARLDLRLAQGVELRRAYRVRPALADIARPNLSERTGSIALGSLERNRSDAVLLELLAPPHAAGDFRLLRASLHADDPGGGPLDPAASDLVVSYGEGAQAATDPRLLPLIDRVAAWRLQTRALEAAANGDANGATRQLQAVITRLVDLGEHDLAAQTAATVEQLAARGTVEAGQAKELRYATRRLTNEDQST